MLGVQGTANILRALSRAAQALLCTTARLNIEEYYYSTKFLDVPVVVAATTG